MSPSSETTKTPDLTEAVEARLVVVDPGQVIRINARFPNKPEKVLFSYLPPQNKEAVHDPGFGNEESKIQLEGEALHYYQIDTRGMRGGLGWWYFVSEDPDPTKRRAKVGKFIVRAVPRALIERGARVEEESGYTLLGADSSEPRIPTKTLVAFGLGVGAAVIVLSLL